MEAGGSDTTILAGTGNPELAGAVAHHLGVRRCERVVERFPDGELHVDIRESVRGRDVYVLQPTGPPVDDHLVELLLLADAVRRAGAGRITAVVPYMGYARQDRRAHGREPVSARVFADLLPACGVERIVVVDLHSAAIEGCFSIPVEHLTAVPRLVERLRPRVGRDAVVVSPDLGGVPRAERVANLLDLPVAIVHKTRLNGMDVTVRGVVGEVRDRVPILVDDMISTAGTVVAAIRALLNAGCTPEVHVAATHGVLVPPAADRLRGLPIATLLVTDSLPIPPAFPVPLVRLELAPLLAEAVRRLAREQPVEPLLSGR